jgi:glucose-6-phosphate-specific signal transduction histidine kinase
MSERYAMALGHAVIEAWGHLPQPIQEELFEKAVLAGHRTEKDESLREQLAQFLHDRHPRTKSQLADTAAIAK